MWRSLFAPRLSRRGLARRGRTRHVIVSRAACVARELTKLHEEIVRGSLKELAIDREWRGEVAIVLGAWSPDTRAEAIDDAAIDTRIDRELESGGHAKTIADAIAAWSGRPRREIYERVVRRKNER